MTHETINKSDRPKQRTPYDRTNTLNYVSIPTEAEQNAYITSNDALMNKDNINEVPN